MPGSPIHAALLHLYTYSISLTAKMYIILVVLVGFQIMVPRVFVLSGHFIYSFGIRMDMAGWKFPSTCLPTHRVISGALQWVWFRLHHGARYTCYSNWKIAINYNKPWGLCYFNKLHFYPHRHRFTHIFSVLFIVVSVISSEILNSVDCGDEDRAVK